MRLNQGNRSYSIVQTVSTYIGFELVRQVKCSMIIGAQTAFFSVAGIIAPVFGTSIGSLVAFCLFTALRVAVTSTFFLQPVNLLLISHIPFLVSAFMFAPRSKKLVSLFFIAAMFLFLVNPVGAQAWVYPMLWLIPLAVSAYNNTSVFTRAIRSTFAAHAVGSLIYLYTTSMSSSLWVTLTPIALVERLLFTVGIMGVYYTVAAFSKSYKHMTFLTTQIKI
ncbi:hypothetical protein HOM50_00835 [bacterium]|nr:hypothetical protein [bacterium]MBT5014936.1 hypothetical protein [bacterium]